MKEFKVTAPFVQLHTGHLRLSKAQAQARRYALESLGESLFLIVRPVGFKLGETFGYDGELLKAQAVRLSSATSEPEPEQKPEPEPEPESELEPEPAPQPTSPQPKPQHHRGRR
jgi:hypothetical protein